MATRGALALGTLVGIALGAVLTPAAVAPRESSMPRVRGQLLDEAAGPLAEVSIAYVPEAAFLTEPIYGAFLATLDARTRIVALVPPVAGGLDPATELRRFLSRLPQGEVLL